MRTGDNSKHIDDENAYDLEQYLCIFHPFLKADFVHILHKSLRFTFCYRGINKHRAFFGTSFTLPLI